jgi:hypothetical protein
MGLGLLGCCRIHMAGSHPCSDHAELRLAIKWFNYSVPRMAATREQKSSGGRVQVFKLSVTMLHVGVTLLSRLRNTQRTKDSKEDNSK